jgi:alternate signal-mediated exported protein
VGGGRHASELSSGLRRRTKRYIVTAAVTAISVVAVTLALWNAGGTHGSLILTSGSMVATEGSFGWADVTPGAASGSLASGTDAASLEARKLTPGDVYNLSQDIELEAEGDNLTMKLTAKWDSGASSPLVGVYQLKDRALGTVLAGGAGVPLGSVLELEDLTEGNHAYTLFVTLRYPDTETPLYQGQAGASTTSVTLGKIEVTAEQVR